MDAKLQKEGFVGTRDTLKQLVRDNADQLHAKTHMQTYAEFKAAAGGQVSDAEARPLHADETANQFVDINYGDRPGSDALENSAQTTCRQLMQQQSWRLRI